QVSRLDLVDVLRRQGHANDGQLLPPAVDHRQDAVAGLEVVGLGERLADQHLAGTPRLDVAARAQVDVVEAGPLPVRDGDQPAGRGFGQPGDVERHLDDDARIDPGDAGDLGDAVGEAVGGALDVGEGVGEAVALVVDRLAAGQRHQGDLRHDE